MKLVKIDGVYYVKDIQERIGEMVIGSSDHQLCDLLKYPYLLSIQNCEAVFNGYDLDEIVEQIKQTLEDSRISSYDSFKIGFKKALEILGDKKFSEEDVKFMFQLGFNLDNAISRNEYNTHIQSLQQTEWDVEIVMNAIPADRAPDGWDRFPKLDENGCIILKRK